MAILQGSAKASSRGFYPVSIDQSLRFNDNDSAYLQKTFSAPDSETTFTCSAWVKRGNLDTWLPILGCDTGTNAFTFFGIDSNNRLAWRLRNSSQVDVTRVESSALLRDTSAWYHVVLQRDSTQAVAADRAKLYINGQQVTSFNTATYDPLNSAVAGDFFTDMQIGRFNVNLSTRYYADCYLAEVHFTDGTAYDASAFGEFKSGAWVAKTPSVTYGTNGFYLDFANSADIGNDVSGEGNDWTPNNFTASDVVLDSPTDNFATLNVTRKSNTVASNGNLSLTGATQTTAQTATFSVTSGKWYWETTATSLNESSIARWQAGVVTSEWAAFYSETGTSGDDTLAGNNGTVAIRADGSVDVETTNVVSSGSNLTEGDVVGFALNADDDELTIYVNNTALNSGVPFDISGLSQTGYVPAFRVYNTGEVHDINFGQLGFTYTPPTGYLALSTANLPEPTISPADDASPEDYFNTVAYSGNSTDGRTLTGVGFQPDFTWLKIRSSAGGHQLQDAVRGANKSLTSNSTGAENTDYSLGYISSFASDGFVLEEGTDADGFFINNKSGQTYVAWNWKANGSGTTIAAESIDGTNPTIASQVSANTTSGFSIVSYTGNTTDSSATIAHGLNSAPEMILVKTRDSVRSWNVYHSGVASDAETDYLILDDTNGAQDNVNRWNDTAPNADYFTVGNSNNVFGSTDDYIAYCFHSVEGFSKFGSYTGNGSTDGTFVYTGFRPAFVLVKKTSATASWYILDAARDAYNVVDSRLYPDLSNAEGTTDTLDFLSNGFKYRATTVGLNESGATYIYACFAENPFKYSNAR